MNKQALNNPAVTKEAPAQKIDATKIDKKLPLQESDKTKPASGYTKPVTK